MHPFYLGGNDGYKMNCVSVQDCEYTEVKVVGFHLNKECFLETIQLDNENSKKKDDYNNNNNHISKSDDEEEDVELAAPLSRHIATSQSVLLPPATLKNISLKFDFFNRAEQVVMESLSRDYWNAFVQSPYWTKLQHFLWYQDRRVVPDDFFVMRVLGRGGFGLVTGTWVLLLCCYCALRARARARVCV